MLKETQVVIMNFILHLYSYQPLVSGVQIGAMALQKVPDH